MHRLRAAVAENTSNAHRRTRKQKEDMRCGAQLQVVRAFVVANFRLLHPVKRRFCSDLAILKGGGAAAAPCQHGWDGRNAAAFVSFCSVHLGVRVGCTTSDSRDIRGVLRAGA